MKRAMILIALLMTGCATHSRLMSDVRAAQKWDVFWFDKGETKIMVVPADKWEFRDGCFIAEKPVRYILCDVFRVRPCTEDCG